MQVNVASCGMLHSAIERSWERRTRLGTTSRRERTSPARSASRAMSTSPGSSSTSSTPRGRARSQSRGSALGAPSGRVKLKVAPRSDCTGSSQMRPPWNSTMRRHRASPMPVPPYWSRRCSRWKTAKIRSAYCGSMPMPLSRTVTRHSAPGRARRRSTTGGDVLAAVLDRVADEVLEQRGEQRPVAVDGRQRGQPLDPAPGSRDPVAQRARAWSSAASRSTGTNASVRAPDPRQRQQVGDQDLHALRAVDGEVDVLPGPVVELRRRTGARAAGRSSRPCAAARTGRARRRRRTAAGRRWSARARRPAAQLLRDLLGRASCVDDLGAHGLDVAAEAGQLDRPAGSMRRCRSPEATARVWPPSRSTGASTQRCSPRHSASPATASSEQAMPRATPAKMPCACGPRGAGLGAAMASSAGGRGAGCVEAPRPASSAARRDRPPAPRRSPARRSRAASVDRGARTRRAGADRGVAADERRTRAVVAPAAPVVGVRRERAGCAGEQVPAHAGLLVDEVGEQPLAGRERRLPPVDHVVAGARTGPSDTTTRRRAPTHDGQRRNARPSRRAASTPAPAGRRAPRRHRPDVIATVQHDAGGVVDRVARRAGDQRRDPRRRRVAARASRPTAATSSSMPSESVRRVRRRPRAGRRCRAAPTSRRAGELGLGPAGRAAGHAHAERRAEPSVEVAATGRRAQIGAGCPATPHRHRPSVDRDVADRRVARVLGLLGVEQQRQRRAGSARRARRPAAACATRPAGGRRARPRPGRGP